MIAAFTQGKIDVPNIYIKQPLGFVNRDHPHYVLQLLKALYGLKQSARIWLKTLKEKLLKRGFKNILSEPNIYINTDLKLIICVYVDDLAVLGTSEENILSFIKDLKKEIDIKIIGPIKDYLGIEVDYNREKGIMRLTQVKYIEKIIQKYAKGKMLTKYIPLAKSIKLEPNTSRATVNQTKWYQGAIGSLLFLALATRPDICFAVIKLARFSINPSEIHINCVLNIFWYLYKNMNIGIIYTKNHFSSRYISGYCDSDWAGDVSTFKSTTGWIFFLANGPISWKSKLQSVHAQSSTEAEYIAAAHAAREAQWIISLLKEIGFYHQKQLALYIDNKGANDISKNPVFHERTKHIALKYHYIRELVEKGIINLILIPTEKQIADGFTKPLDKNLFRKFIKDLNMA